MRWHVANGELVVSRLDASVIFGFHPYSGMELFLEDLRSLVLSEEQRESVVCDLCVRESRRYSGTLLSSLKKMLAVQKSVATWVSAIVVVKMYVRTEYTHTLENCNGSSIDARTQAMLVLIQEVTERPHFLQKLASDES